MPRPGDSSPAKPSRSVLIVDDDPAVLEALGAALTPQFQVVTAQTGAEALEVLGQHLLDLVLLDQVLPDIPGLSILAIIKRYLPSLPVILMTGHGSEEMSVDAFRGGARDYLKKPIRLQELWVRIDHVLHARRRTGEVGPAVPAPGAEVLWAIPEVIPDENLRRALEFIDANLHTHLLLEHVAREGGMSKFHFCRHFKSVMGMSFREFLARRRIERASVLLRDQKRTVTEVYLDVGFKDLSHFGRVFRRITGQLPSQFRFTYRDKTSQD
jgi:YesN/AraC family two-component response regulator